MMAPEHYWKNNNPSFEDFFKTKDVTIFLELLQNSKNDPIYFGNISDYITTEYYYENRFSWADWTPSLWETLHEQSHYFLQQSSIDSSVCSNATHKSALQFLGLFNTMGDSQLLANYLQLANYTFKEEELRDVFLWTLTRVLQRDQTIPSQQLIDWVLTNISCEWFLDYQSKIISILGHHSNDILNWTKEHFYLLSKVEQENILAGAISVREETMFYTLVFNEISTYEKNIQVSKESNSYINLYSIYSNTPLYIKTLESLPPYSATKELLSLTTIHRDYNLTHKKNFFKKILLHNDIAIDARISLFLKLLKHTKSYSYFITPTTYKQFIDFLQQKLKESEELILPEQYDIEKGLEDIQHYITQQSTTIPKKWYNKWVSV